MKRGAHTATDQAVTVVSNKGWSHFPNAQLPHWWGRVGRLRLWSLPNLRDLGSSHISCTKEVCLEGMTVWKNRYHPSLMDAVPVLHYIQRNLCCTIKHFAPASGTIVFLNSVCYCTHLFCSAVCALFFLKFQRNVVISYFIRWCCTLCITVLYLMTCISPRTIKMHPNWLASAQMWVQVDGYLYCLPQLECSSKIHRNSAGNGAWPKWQYCTDFKAKTANLIMDVFHCLLFSHYTGTLAFSVTSSDQNPSVPENSGRSGFNLLVEDQKHISRMY